MILKNLFLLAILMVFASGGAIAQNNYDNVEITVQQVNGDIYMLEGAGGNIGVSAGSDGLLMIDDEFAPLADKIKATLAALHKGNLHFILNTHYHGDHTGGNEIFGREAPIIAQENVRTRLKAKSEPEGALPVVTFDRSVSIYFNGEEIKVIHYPHCHTDGDAIVYFTGSNVVHTGDLLFSGRFPFVDIDAGGDVENLTRTIKTFIEEWPEDIKIIPGHGPLSTKDDLKTYYNMLVETTDIVRGWIQSGKSLEEAQALHLPEKWQSWQWSFIDEPKWIGIIYTSLTKKS